jgi:hypothetical protein
MLKRLLAGVLAALLFAQPAAAQLLLGVSNGASIIYSASRGVYIPPDTWFGTATALGVTNSKPLTVAFWINGTNDSGAPVPTSLLNSVLFLSDPASKCEVTGGTSKGLCFSFDNSAFFAQFNLNNSVGVTAGTDDIKIDGGSSAVFVKGTWNQYVITVNPATGNCAGLHNGVSFVPSQAACSAISNTTPDLNNTAGFHVFNGNNSGNGPTGTAWLSDVWISSDWLGCTGVATPFADCSAANAFPASKAAKFISGGKPVDLGAAGLSPTGTTPFVYLKGDGAAVETNLGSATTAFSETVNPGFTAKTGVASAPYGPLGMVAGRPTLKFPVQIGLGASGTTSFAVAPNAGSQPIAAGDIIVLTFSTVDSSGTVNHALSSPAGYTCGTAGLDTLGSTNARQCYKVAAGGENSISGVSWTTNVTRNANWSVAVYAQASSVGAFCNQVSATATKIDTCTSTTTGVNSTVVSTFTNWDANVSSSMNLSIPGGTELRARTGKSGSPGLTQIVDQYGVTQGSATKVTGTWSATNFGGIGFTLELVP